MSEFAGKTFIVTGGNSGIGYEVCGNLMAKGAHVIIASRSMDKVNQAVAELSKKFPAGKAEGMQLELSSFQSVKSFADAVIAKGIKVDVLLNNAGLFFPPHSKTAEGIEITAAVNHFATYYLTHLLLPVIKSSNSRVVFVSSGACENGKVDWSDLKASKAKGSSMGEYAYSKLALGMVAKDLAKQLQGSGVDIVVADPGFVNSGIVKKSPGFLPKVFGLLNVFFAQTVEEGAQHIYYAATEPSLKGTGFSATGPTKSKKKPTGPWVFKNKSLNNDAECARLHEETKKILAGIAQL